MVFAAPHAPDANKGCRQKGEQKETRPRECMIEKQPAPPRRRKPGQGQHEHDRAADLAEDKIVGDRESACDGISEHAEDENGHAEECICRMFSKLPQGAYRRGDAIVTIRVFGNGRVVFESSEIKRHRYRSKNDPPDGEISADILSEDIRRKQNDRKSRRPDQVTLHKAKVARQSENTARTNFGSAGIRA